MSLDRLLYKNKEVEPATFNRIYGKLVEKEIRKKYSQGDIEAIINNYLLSPESKKYTDEFMELQNYREECKERVKTRLNIKRSNS